MALEALPSRCFDHSRHGETSCTELRSLKIATVHSSKILLQGLEVLFRPMNCFVEISREQVDIDQFQSLFNSKQIDVALVELNEIITTRWVPSNNKDDIAAKIVLLGNVRHHRHLNFFWKKKIGGIVVEQESFEDIAYAVGQVAAGKRYRSPLIASKQKSQNDGTKMKALTARQIQVLRLVSDGLSSKEIANRLSISRKTVENHRARIYQRLGVKTAAAMVNVARDTGWL